MTAARLLLCSMILTAVAVPRSYADDCAPVNAAQVRDAARAFLKVPPAVPLELVMSDRVGTSCYDRLVFETVDERQIRESIVYLSPDRAYLTRDVFAVADTGTPNALADPLSGIAPDAPVRGNSKAQLTLVEFSDFQCPFCRGAANQLAELAAADPNVKVVFRQMPLGMHPWALQAARASSCVRGDNFWKLHDFYFEKQRELTPENVAAKTREYLAGLNSFDAAAFDQCVAGNDSLDAVRRDVRAAALLGVQGTPTIYANGRHIKPSGSVDALRKEIEGATGIALRSPEHKTTYMVFLRPTGRSSSPEIDSSSATFLAQLKKEGELLNAGHAQAAEGAAGFDILTVRAIDAAAALKLISRSPLVTKGIVKAEVVEYQPAASPVVR